MCARRSGVVTSSAIGEGLIPRRIDENEKSKWMDMGRSAHIFLRTSTCFSLRSYSCLTRRFSDSTSCSFSMLNSCMQTHAVQTIINLMIIKKKKMNRKRMEHEICDLRFEDDRRRVSGTDLLRGNRDLAGFLVGLLQDEPDHLLDLLPDIGVVHLGRYNNSTDRRARGGVPRARSNLFRIKVFVRSLLRSSLDRRGRRKEKPERGRPARSSDLCASVARGSGGLREEEET